jgi:hypothetical protein
MRPLLRHLVTEDTRLSLGDRATHTYVIGQPGTGKSRALESWAMQDIRAGHGVAVIDPHGDLFERLLYLLSQNSDYAKRVVVIDPCDPLWVVSFNPLEALRAIPPERLALFLTDVVVKIWNVTPTAAPRMIWLLTNTFLALADLGLTLLDLPQFLLDKSFREKLLPKVKHKNVSMYFEHEFPKPKWLVHEWVTPVLNKIGGLVFDSDMRLLLAKGSPLNFREVIDRNLIPLVHLPKGILGEEASALLAAFIVAQFQKAALSRADSHERPTYFLYLDEFQSYTTDNIADILSESRKYGLSLTLAHQYLDQLPSKLQSAVLNTTGTMVSFRTGYQDAYQLSKEIFPSREFLAPAKWDFNLQHINRLPFISAETQKIPLGWEGLTEKLTNLPNREFWMRRRGLHTPVKLRTLDMPDILLTSRAKDQLARLREISGRAFGRSKREVQRLVARTPAFASTETTETAHKPKSSNPKSEEFSPWGQ